jgi:hypothetical protein
MKFISSTIFGILKIEDAVDRGIFTRESGYESGEVSPDGLHPNSSGLQFESDRRAQTRRTAGRTDAATHGSGVVRKLSPKRSQQLARG